MNLEALTRIDTGVLVIGSGAAGLRAAIEARKLGAEVVLVSKSPLGLGNNTAIARGAMAATTGEGGVEDTPEIHLKDTVVSGRFLNNQRVVQAIVEGAAREVSQLESFGVKFITEDGRRTVSQTPGHTHPRTMACEGHIGSSYTLPMCDYARKVGVRFLDGIMITRILKLGDTVTGAVGLSEGGHIFAFSARGVILAAGGLGQVYLRTNNVAGATGDGYALALDVGARLQDMEFVQFFPTGF